MGNRIPMSSPYPDNYFTITVVPPNVMWIAQAPTELLPLLRKAIQSTWTDGIFLERHTKRRTSNFIKIKSKAVKIGESNAIKKEHLNIGVNPMRNSLIYFNGKPFLYDSLDAQKSSSVSFARMISKIWTVLDNLGYKLVNCGRYIKCVEASTCIFQKTHTSSIPKEPKDPNSNLGHRNFEEGSQITNMMKDQIIGKSVISFEGLNRLVFINILPSVVDEIEKHCKKHWPTGLEVDRNFSVKTNSHNINKVTKNGSQSNGHLKRRIVTRTNIHESFASESDSIAIIEFNGCPWDSFKEHAEKSPRIVIGLLQIMIRSGYLYQDRASLRGFQDFWVFDGIKPNSTLNKPNIDPKSNCESDLCGLLLHRTDGLRIFINSGFKTQVVVGRWLERLIDDLWEPGTNRKCQNRANNSQIKNENTEINESTNEDNNSEADFYEIKIHSNPWWTSEWDKDGQTNARFLISRILGCMELTGYRFIANINLYRSQYDKTLLIFRYFLSEEGNPEHGFSALDSEVILKQRAFYETRERPKFFSMYTISPYDTDKICIRGCPYQIQNYIKEYITNQIEANDSFLTAKDRSRVKRKKQLLDHKVIHDNSANYKKTNNAKGEKQPNFQKFQISMLPSPFIQCYLHEIPQNSHDCVWIRSNLTRRYFQSPIRDNGVGYMEFTLQHHPWYGNTEWTHILRRVIRRSNYLNDFLEIQMSLALLLWLHNILRAAVMPKTKPFLVQCVTDKKGEEEIEEDQQKNVIKLGNVKNQLVLAGDFSSCGKLSPPTWIFVSRHRLLQESEYNLDENNLIDASKLNAI